MIVLPGHHSTVTLEVIRADGEIEELPFDWHNGTDTRQSISVDFVAGRIVVKAEKADAKAERTEGETVPSPLGNFSAVSSPSFTENTELIQIQGVKQVSAVSSPQKDAHAKQNGKAQKGGRKLPMGRPKTWTAARRHCSPIRARMNISGSGRITGSSWIILF